MGDDYRSLHSKIVELTNVIIRKFGTGGYFFVVCSPNSFEPLKAGNIQYEYAAKCTKGVVRRGLMDGEWQIYTDVDMKDGLYLIGSSAHPDASLSYSEPRRYATLTLCNFTEGQEEENLAEIVANLSRMSKS